MGETCTPNGLISKAANGSPVWCVDGVWKGNEGNTIVSSGTIGNNTTFTCGSGASGKILVHAYFNWVVHYGVYQMSANLYANGELADSDRTAAFEYDHGRASGSSVTLFHTVNTFSGNDYTFSVVVSVEPYAVPKEQAGGRAVFEIHHKIRIVDGGSVYDIENMSIATPKRHIMLHSKEVS